MANLAFGSYRISELNLNVPDFDFVSASWTITNLGNQSAPSTGGPTRVTAPLFTIPITADTDDVLARIDNFYEATAPSPSPSPSPSPTPTPSPSPSPSPSPAPSPSPTPRPPAGNAPATGDFRQTAVFVILLIVGIGAMGGVCVYWAKKKFFPPDK